MKQALLLICAFMLIVTSCKKEAADNNVPVKYGTYTGITVRNFSCLTMEGEDISAPSYYTDTLNVININEDSIQVTFSRAGNSTFQRNLGDSIYPNIRTVYGAWGTYSFTPTNDSLSIQLMFSDGGECGGSFNFQGKRVE